MKLQLGWNKASHIWKTINQHEHIIWVENVYSFRVSFPVFGGIRVAHHFSLSCFLFVLFVVLCFMYTIMSLSLYSPFLIAPWFSLTFNVLGNPISRDHSWFLLEVILVCICTVVVVVSLWSVIFFQTFVFRFLPITNELIGKVLYFCPRLNYYRVTLNMVFDKDTMSNIIHSTLCDKMYWMWYYQLEISNDFYVFVTVPTALSSMFPGRRIRVLSRLGVVL